MLARNDGVIQTTYHLEQCGRERQTQQAVAQHSHSHRLHGHEARTGFGLHRRRMSRGVVVLELAGAEHQLVVVGRMKDHTRHLAHMLQTPSVVDSIVERLGVGIVERLGVGIVERLGVRRTGSIEDRSHSAWHMGRGLEAECMEAVAVGMRRCRRHIAAVAAAAAAAVASLRLTCVSVVHQVGSD